MPIESFTSSLNLVYPKYMLFCVVVASLNFFCIGWVTGSSNLPGTITHACENGIAHAQTPLLPDCLPMNDAWWGFAVSSFCVGALIGGLSGGYIQTKFGRRKTIFYNSFGYTIGGILIGCSTSPSMFVVGRIICGLSCGLGSLTVPIYVGEISTVKSRGVMGTINQMMTSTGILLSCIIGLPLSTVPLWRVSYAIVTVPALIQTILMPFCTESPRYLVSINKIPEAKASLQRLRPNASIDMELYTMIEGQLGLGAAIEAPPLSTPPLPTPPPVYSNGNSSNLIKEAKTSMNMIQIFRDPLTRQVAVIVILIHCLQQLIGINAVMYYSSTMFTKAFNPDMSKYMAIVCSAVNFLLTVVSIFLIDRTGRRSLLLASQAGACIFTVLLTIGYVHSINALMVLSLLSYVAFFAVGMGPVPWVLISELSPVYASSSVGSAAAAMNWAMNFLIGQCFPIIFSRIQGYSFLIFAIIAFNTLLFTYFKVPETKGRSIEDITAGFQAAKELF
ncbi:hypothetical protein MUCCIDRAFT_147650 [Mucor lusitanicus CBS 277.49]|uniref:Major facilitator superfamily (MFS) profile domain-containing protein n=1 Tax=Mucor lusitanicus CBS 277.49 TaxID=747725 RepID=A0A168IK32_MUCCL|nr:hypothetical protein MUCCIDRAFT_147650 [Mucor lusitanicus CBS 277.49]